MDNENEQATMEQSQETITPPQELTLKETQEQPKEETVPVQETISSQEQAEQKAETSKENTEEIIEQKNIDYTMLQTEVDAFDKLSDETRAKLNEAGITNEMIDVIEDGMKLKKEALIAERASVVGGVEKYNEILNWAGKNLSPDEIQEINSVQSIFAQKAILKELQSRMNEKEGIPSNLVTGTGGASSTPDIFESQAQMIEAIKNPLYAKDPAYRAKVTKKIAASRQQGINLGV